MFSILGSWFPLIVTKQASKDIKGKGLCKGLHQHHTEGKEVKLTMEVEWIADRATLRSLAREHPEWSQQDRASAVGRALPLGQEVAEAIAGGSSR